MDKVDEPDPYRVPTGEVPDSSPHPQGLPVIRKFPFQFDTPGLTTGVSIYTPNINDILLNVWVEINTGWDGTTPYFDMGRFLDRYTTGWWNGLGGPLPLIFPDVTEGNLDFGMLTGSEAGLFNQLEGGVFPESSSLLIQGLMSYIRTSNTNGVQLQIIPRIVPAKFVTADPIKIVVSQTGHIGGASPGATQGKAIVYLITATPI